MRKRQNRNLFISVEEAIAAIEDKSRLEALAFSVQIKHTFSSSSLKNKNTTKKHLKSLFKMGSAKLSRILKNAEFYGYIRYESNMIIANPLRSGIEVVGVIKVKEGIMTNDDAIKNIRRIVLMDKIKTQGFYLDSCKKTHEGNKRKRNNEVRGKKPNFKGISYDRLAEIVKLSRRGVINLVDDIVESGYIRRNSHYETYTGTPNPSDSQKAMYAELGVHLVFVHEVGKLCIQNPNLYFLNRKRDIRWVSFPNAKRIA